jgi:hypothetical protein
MTVSDVEAVPDAAAAGPVDRAERDLLAETFRKTMSAASGQVLDRALAELGWREMLAELPEVAIPMAFRLLGETGAHAPLLNDVLLHAAGREAGGTLPLPYAGRLWVLWDRGDRRGTALTAARHCQQVLGGIGFTAEHGLHRHVRRALVLDGLLGSARELTREAGSLLIKERCAPRLVDL